MEANNINKAPRDKGLLFLHWFSNFFACMCAKIVVLVFKNLFLSRRNENEMEEQLSRSHALTPFCFILLFLTSAKNLWCRRSFLVCARRQRCISLVVYVCYGSECKKRLVKVSRFGRIRDELFVSSRDIKREIQPTEQCALFQPASSTGSFRCQITKVEFLHAQRTGRQKNRRSNSQLCAP